MGTIPCQSSGGAFDRAVIEVTARRTDTHTADIVDAAYDVECGLKGVNGCFHVVIDVGIGLRFDGSLCDDGAALIHDTETELVPPMSSPIT